VPLARLSKWRALVEDVVGGEERLVVPADLRRRMSAAAFCEAGSLTRSSGGRRKPTTMPGPLVRADASPARTARLSVDEALSAREASSRL